VREVVRACVRARVSLLQPDVNRMVCLPNIDLTAFTCEAVYFWCLQFQVVLGRLKETRYFP
jgi:hypothetical protein